MTEQKNKFQFLKIEFSNTEKIINTMTSYFGSYATFSRNT